MGSRQGPVVTWVDGGHIVKSQPSVPYGHPSDLRFPLQMKLRGLNRKVCVCFSQKCATNKVLWLFIFLLFRFCIVGVISFVALYVKSHYKQDVTNSELSCKKKIMLC